MKLNLKPKTLMMFGLVCLVLANVIHSVLRKKIGLSEDGSDFVFGALMGLFFGAVVLFLIQSRKRST
jgi:hypothetical protein